MIAATIIAILFIFGGGGGPFGDLTAEYVKEPIKETIVEEDRREMALDELDALKDSIEDFNAQVSKDIERLDKLVKNYESTPEEFDQLISSAFTRRQQEVEKIWKQRSAMLAHIKADEWTTIINSAKAKMKEESK